MGLLDGADGPLSEVSDALSDLGMPGAADDLNQATQWIQDALNNSGTLPLPRTRFLIGELPQPGTTPVDRVDWTDAITQAGNLGGALLQAAGVSQGKGYGQLAAAFVDQELFDTADKRHDYEHPVHLVSSFEVHEELNQLWTATVTLLKPNLPGALPTMPVDMLQQLTDALTDDGNPGYFQNGPGLLPTVDGQDWNEVQTLIGTIRQAVNNPGGLASQVWATEDPDELDQLRLTLDHAQEPTRPYVGRTVPTDYLGKFARLCVARRFSDNNFTLNERWFSGTVTAFEDLGFAAAPSGLPTNAQWRQVRLTIRPRLFQLSLRQRHRIFKGKNAVEIVLDILKDHGVYPKDAETGVTALRLEPGGRELFGPLAIPDQLTSMVDQVAGAVPNDLGVGVGDAINSALEESVENWRPKRDFCVQYGETDLAFVKRLLAEAGLTFFFESRETLETLVICEDPRLAGKKVLTAGRRPLEVTAQSPSPLPVIEWSWGVGVARVPVPSGVKVRDRSFARPYESTDLSAGESLDMLSPGGLSSLTTLGGLEQMANQAVGLMTEASGTPGTEDYAGPEALWFEWPSRVAFPETAEDEQHSYDAFDGPPMGQLRLEHFRSRGAITRGGSNCATLNPGHHVNLLHGAFDVLHAAVQKPQRFFVTSVVHRGTLSPTPAQPYLSTYTNAFEAQNANLPTRPAKPERPTIRGVQTAIVIDTQHLEDPAVSGAEVSVLPKQSAWRVKVRFPWEREAEVGSHWIRFAQPFSGAGFGTLLVPRVGMEVVVGFDEGDPDRPYVLSTLYCDTYDGASGPRHASSVEPKDTAVGRVDHPARLTDAGFRSRSWPQKKRGEGTRANRLRFDDFAGNERIEVYAQKDLAKEVGGKLDDEPYGDHVTTVLGPQVNDVGENQREAVFGDQTLLARHASAGPGDWGRMTKVIGKETVEIGGGSERSTSERDPEKRDAMTDVVRKSDRLTVLGERALHVAGDETIQIEGEGASLAGAKDERPGRLLDVSANASVHVEKNDEFVVSGDRRVLVEGAFELTAEKLDMKVVTAGDTSTGREGEEVGGIEVDEEGARLTSKGSIDIETETFTAESEGGQMLVKAATRIEVHSGENRITLDGVAKTITMNVAAARRFWLGTEGGYIEADENHLLLTAAGSSWKTSVAADGTLSELEGPTVTIAATDEIALEAPAIHFGEPPKGA